MSDIAEILQSLNRRTYGQALQDAATKIDIKYELPQGVLDFGEPWQLAGDWMVVGDVHVPTTNWELAALVGEVARRHLKKPRRLLIAGDLFNFDKFGTYAVVAEPPTWAMERDAARKLLGGWFKVFDEIRAIPGNHERRLQKFTLGAFETADIMQLIISNPDKLKMNHFGYCWITSAGEKFRISHPKNYSINQLVVAEALANKHQAHIISFHEHHLSKGWDRFKNFMVINGGSLADMSRLPYAILDDSKAARSASGFVMIRDGVPHVFGEPPFTDWTLWLKRR